MNLTILSSVSGIISALQTGQAIYYTVAATMDSVQSQGTLKGNDKKIWVLEYIKNFVKAMEDNWEVWEKLIIDFIDVAKSLYNIAKKVIN